jgi:hypothetical protein
MRHLAFVLLLGLGGPALAAADPATAAADFYAVYAGQHGQGGGIPDATGRVRYAPVLSPRLNARLAAAAAAQARLTARVKNAVPPMLEGDIFTSLFEGATSWKVGACTANGDVARCPVALAYAPKPQAGTKPVKPANWNDTLLLVKGAGGWKVDDIQFDAGFAFGNTGKLSDMLALVIAENP